MTRLFALVAIALTGALGALPLPRQTKSSASAPQQQAPVSPQEITAACGACHDAPPPSVLPRKAWRESFERMAFIRSGQPQQGGRGSASGSMSLPSEWVRVLEQYERLAPERLAAPERWPRPDTSRFVRRFMTPKDLAGEAPTIANVRLGDVDGDGVPEVLATDMRHGLVLQGRPSIRDGLERIASVPHPARISLADLDGDGRKEFLVADLGGLLPADHRNGAVVWLRAADGGGYVQQALEGWPRVADARAADFDANGKLDIAVAAFGWRTVGRVSVLENRTAADGQRSVAEHVVDARPGAIDAIPVDLNQDGRLDLVVLLSQHFETVVAYINKGTPPFVFEPIVLYKAPHANWGSSGIAIADLDSDKDLDIIVTNGDSFDDAIVKPYHGIQWLEHQGGLTFVAHRLAAMPGVHRADAADIDGDGDLDIVASALLAAGSDRDESQLPALVWLEQTTRGVFERRTLLMGTPRHPTLDLGDIDRDGDVDIVVGVMSPDATGPWVEVWENRRK